MTLKEQTRHIKQSLTDKYTDAEATAIIRTIFDHLLDYTPVDIVLHYDKELSDYILDKCEKITTRLLNGEPIQYIVGEARFFGNKFIVNKSVLIPRPETEELVDIIVDEHKLKNDLRVLDICTGSGCIAISLARNLPFSTVEGIDISESALDIAKRNNAILKTNVDFRKEDALTLNGNDSEYYDIIVSNPPYILERERVSISSSVLDYEPEIALFVPNDNPIIFYNSILEYSIKALRRGGSIYLEINPLCAEQIREQAIRLGFVNVSIIKDMSRNDRFVIAHR